MVIFNDKQCDAKSFQNNSGQHLYCSSASAHLLRFAFPESHSSPAFRPGFLLLLSTNNVANAFQFLLALNSLEDHTSWVASCCGGSKVGC